MRDVLEPLAQLALQAEREFQESSYGQSVCRLHKDGQVNNRLKYCEGRDYVIRRILKLAKRSEDLPVVESALSELERKNRGVKKSLVLTGGDWQSYADGALDMVQEIRLLLSQGHMRREE